MIVYVFGDQVEDYSTGLPLLLLSEHDPILDAFLAQSYKIIRREMLSTPPLTLPSFSSLLDIARWRSLGVRNLAVEHALTTVYQIGEFMRSLSELLPRALEAVNISFHVGRLVSNVADCTTISSSAEDSWALSIHGLSREEVTEILVHFEKSQAVPVTSKPYISGVSLRSVIVSGPPSTIKLLKESQFVTSLKCIQLPLHAPYHASHLYSDRDMESILSLGTLVGNESRDFQAIPVISSSTGRISTPSTTKSTLEVAVRDILCEELRLDFVLNSLFNKIQGLPNTTKLRNLLIPIATSTANGLAAALQDRGIDIQMDIDSGLDSELPNPNHIYQASLTKNAVPIPIAILGISGRFPSAGGLDEFWDILVKGLDVHKTVPTQRWDVTSHTDPTGRKKNTSATPFGCWLDEPEMFDARFFGISPREAAQIDPAQRLALMTAYEALEQAGIVPDGSPSTRRDRVGVYYGVTSNDWMETNTAQQIDSHFIPGGNRAFIPGRVNYHFKFSGPSYCIDTACSSSLTAIYVACSSLWRGEADTIVAGGTNIITNPDFTAGLDRGFFLSRTGNCKTFDETADGYCRGEGVVTLVLKRLEDALAENDPVLAVISNAHTNHSAEAESITRPFFGAQKSAIDHVLAGVNPDDVSYAELHGTGTQSGDATEMTSVLASLTSDTTHERELRHRPLYLGSAKANVGHGEAAAGAISLAKVILMMRNDTIPPHCGIKTRINSKFPSDLASRKVLIANKPVVWKRDGVSPRRVLVNNFSAAGGNTSLLVEDAPPKPRIDCADNLIRDVRSVSVVTVSAKSLRSLTNNLQKMLDFVSSEDPARSLHLPSLAYTTTARRMHHAYRVAVTATSMQSLANELKHAIEMKFGQTRTSSAPTTLFAFGGQGSQYIGMGKALFDTVSSFRADIHRYDKMAQAQGVASILPLITSTKGDISQFSPSTVQVATVSLQMAISRFWRICGIQPSAVIGHSLGHYAALNCAGVLSETETIFLVAARAQLLEENCISKTHSMLAVKASLIALENLLDHNHMVEPACINSPEDVVLSGLHQDIEDCARLLHSDGIRAIRLSTPYAFHSAQVDCILEEYIARARTVSYHAPLVPVICPLEGKIIDEIGVVGPGHLAAHCRGQVNIVRAVDAANRRDTWKTVSEVLARLYMAGVDIQWREYHRDFVSTLGVIPLPPYSWDVEPYWIQYVNDWSLRKGDPPVICQNGDEKSTAPRFLDTTVYKTVHEEIGQTSGLLVVQLDLSKDNMKGLVQGHKVNGIPLCTPSVYADIAFTLGTYLQRYRSAENRKQVTICNMEVERALVAQETSPQWLRTTVEVDWSKETALCSFVSVDSQGTTLLEHARCSIHFRQEHILTNQHAKEVQRKIEDLREGLASDRCYKYNKPMIYRMVATVAEFDSRYRGLKEIILDSNSMAASGTLDFRALVDMNDGSRFSHTHPAYIDAFSQVAGFVMNANDNSDLEKEVFVNHGWDSLEFYTHIDPTIPYQCYTEMTRYEGSLYQGSVIIISSDKVVGKFENLKLLGVNKKILHSILSLAYKAPSQVSARQELKKPKSFVHTPITVSSDDSESVLESNINAKISVMFKIIIEESGVGYEDLQDDTLLASVGIDSLLSLIITSRLKDDLGFYTKSGSTVFDEFRTVGELKSEVIRFFNPPSSSSSESPDSSMDVSTGDSSSAVTESCTKEIFQERNTQHEESNVTTATFGSCSSVVLQGPSTTSGVETGGKILFLFPDGSGSALSYVDIPPVSESVTIIGLISPFRKHPEAMKMCNLDELISIYLAEIRRRQSCGPYSLGGWSAGGILAHRTMTELIQQGDTVESLVLIDSPDPTSGLGRLPRRFYDHCQEQGIFGQIERFRNETNTKSDGTEEQGGNKYKNGMQIPPWLIPHFNATIDILHDYHAEPLIKDSGCLVEPRVSIYLATECIFDGNDYASLPDMPGEATHSMKFLTEPRTDFTPGGWAQLFPEQEIRVQLAYGANHFSMMVSSGIPQLVFVSAYV
ncbi:Acyl transferase/acyl hydrolase/lysophospholipase [Penicillium occitanis (nom. inval.)]|nr:Acyl transferase/acyl hydrolase/lysophospholipase [Penicillium occitanis (nom. inval.)]PCH00630.1 hypothetical protein PENOC_052170 [Penicillium occitanis (nom. inval.)]